MAAQTASPLEAAIAAERIKNAPPAERLLTREEILGQTAERFGVDEADLEAAYQYFQRAARREARAARQTQPLDEPPPDRPGFMFNEEKQAWERAGKKPKTKWRDGQKVRDIIYDEAKSD
jgi:hypothetical protein